MLRVEGRFAGGLCIHSHTFQVGCSGFAFVSLAWKLSANKVQRGSKYLVINELGPKTIVDMVFEPQLLDNKVSGPSRIQSRVFPVPAATCPVDSGPSDL